MSVLGNAVVEPITGQVIEPVLYGHRAGLSPIAIITSATFWTWLWGMLGILLSTPLTVCLAVLGKYVPSLGIFATLLGEEAEIEPDVKFYQRLVALDRDGAGRDHRAGGRHGHESQRHKCDHAGRPVRVRVSRAVGRGQWNRDPVPAVNVGERRRRALCHRSRAVLDPKNRRD